MYVNDPIADMLTRVRNANMIYSDSVDVLLLGLQVLHEPYRLGEVDETVLVPVDDQERGQGLFAGGRNVVHDDGGRHELGVLSDVETADEAALGGLGGAVILDGGVFVHAANVRGPREDEALPGHRPGPPRARVRTTDRKSVV